MAIIWIHRNYCQKIHSPTAIQPISSDSRRAEPLNTTPTSFPNPIVNIQNAPTAPDPTGLASLSQLLSNPNFENITGLDQNQKNALQALVSSYDATKKFGELSTSLGIKGMELASQIAAIRAAKENNQIEGETANELTESAIRSNINASGSENGVTEGLSQIRQIRESVNNGDISEATGEELTREIVSGISRDNQTGSLIESTELRNALSAAGNDPNSSIFG